MLMSSFACQGAISVEMGLKGVLVVEAEAEARKGLEGERAVN